MQSTAIARSMEAFGDSPHYDAASKKLMSFKDVVAWILSQTESAKENHL